jgi:hypothetical protein
MTKARDLASASIVPAAVSVTELGYIDGVTSAIQTQMDTKAATAATINPTIVDAKGDLIAATAADAVARLAVGANDTVLTADSAQATGMKWAAAAGGGADISCRVFQNAGNTLTNSNTYYALNFQTESFDTNVMHDNNTNNSRITIKTAGKYLVGGGVGTTSNSALGIKIILNGATDLVFQTQGNSTLTEGANCSVIFNFSVNDYVELAAKAGTAGSNTIASLAYSFWAIKIG